MGVIGKVISGGFNKIIIRQSSKSQIELGELLVGENPNEKLIFQVYDLIYGSQLSQQALELVSGMHLEEDSDTEILDFGLRNYTLGLLKGVLAIQNGVPRIPKSLPLFFSDVRRLMAKDIPFFSKPEDSVFLGKLRSGTNVLDIEIWIDGVKALPHHILISAQTGKGKSNLAKVLLYKALGNTKSGFLVLDPHDEYYGRHGPGLKDNPRGGVVYYTPSNPPPGSRSLVISLDCLKPQHFEGALGLSDPQWQAMGAYFKAYKENWIEAIVLEKDIKMGFLEATLNVVKRRLVQLLDLSVVEDKLISKGVFSLNQGKSTVADICREVESGKLIIVDTSVFSKALEVLVGSLVSTEILKHYKHFKYQGTLKSKPPVSIVIEEAPRVLGKEVLEKGSNIFSTIAREGRKFKIGLIAITQLPSLIPKDILANMNTKIILGTEMATERQALINSAAQDLSSDDRTIASLDIGEAIISSSFLKMATPVRIPFFDSLIKKAPTEKIKFLGLN